MNNKIKSSFWSKVCSHIEKCHEW